MGRDAAGKECDKDAAEQSRSYQDRESLMLLTQRKRCSARLSRSPQPIAQNEANDAGNGDGDEQRKRHVEIRIVQQRHQHGNKASDLKS